MLAFRENQTPVCREQICAAAPRDTIDSQRHLLKSKNAGARLAMTPSTDASGQPVGLADAFDVPVFVRHSSPLDPESRPRKSRVDRAAQPWPGTRRAPSAGNYLIPTTWREVLDAAMPVGRDPLPWLAAVPGLASAEIIARRSPPTCIEPRAWRRDRRAISLSRMPSTGRGQRKQLAPCSAIASG